MSTTGLLLAYTLTFGGLAKDRTLHKFSILELNKTA